VANAIRATIADLYVLEGNAELVESKIIMTPPKGDLPSSASGAILLSLYQYARVSGFGRAYSSGVAYMVRLSHRESFSPDASFYTGERSGMRFLEGAPVFAVEVRSENDYGDAAERNMAQKRADYFACGTLVVWDVDLLGTEVIRSYRADAPYSPRVFKKDELANAEPALPDWTFAVTNCLNDFSSLP
jgi:Uma2 family endonuclease